MATAKQKRAVEKMVENGGKDNPQPVGEILREVGYSEAIAKNPQKITESKGFKKLLDEYIPDDLILTALREDILNKPEKRLGELALAAKLKGWENTRPDNNNINLTQVNLNSDKDLGKEFLEYIKESTKDGHD